MLKRIEKNQLSVGMFIEGLEGSFLDTPFAGRRFLLESETDAKALKRSNLSGVFINTAKGLDVSAAGAVKRTNTNPDARNRRADRAAAQAAISQSTTLLKGVFDSVRSGGSVSTETVAPIVGHITQSVDRSADILISMTRLKSRDEATFLHSIAVSALMVRFARYLKLDEETVGILGMSGLLHDIGKLAVPAELLTKDGALTDGEMMLMKDHPAEGHRMLSREGGIPEIVLDICLHHHERPDGKGYPFGLSGDALSPYVHMSTICDVYDAITSARPYKRAWSQREATAWMLERKGHFDRKLLLQFVNGVLQS